MLSLDAMRKLRNAYDPFSGVSEADVLPEIGNPSRDAIIDTALEGLQSDDRNVRVLMLRVLAGQSGGKAVRGILAGLGDLERRVRETAIKSCGNYGMHPAVTARLTEIVTDDGEKTRIRRFALDWLARATVTAKNGLASTAADALRDLAKIPRCRSEILFRLLQMELVENVEELLREVVRDGSKDEAVMATRALCGYRVIHLGAFEGAPDIQSRIKQTCEVAAGRVYYWVKREEYEALRNRPRDTAEA